MSARPGARRIEPTAHQEAYEFAGMIADRVSRLLALAEDGDEDAATRLLELRDELQSFVGEMGG